MKIFITVGNCPQPFSRIFDEVNRYISAANLADLELYCQYGYTQEPLFPDGLKVVKKDFFTDTEFKSLIRTCDRVISHCGVGSIIECLSVGKKPIVLPRSANNGEHIDNHQHELYEYLSSLNYVEKLADVEISTTHLDVKKKRLHFPTIPVQSANFVCVSSVGGHRVAMELAITQQNFEVVKRITDEEFSGTVSGDYYRFPTCNKKRYLFLRVFSAISLLRTHPGAGVYTTGAGVGLAFIIAAKILNRETIAQESMTRVDKTSKWFSVAKRLANFTVAASWSKFDANLRYYLV